MGEYWVLEQLEKVLVLLVVILFGRLVRYLVVILFDLMLSIMVIKLVEIDDGCNDCPHSLPRIQSYATPNAIHPS